MFKLTGTNISITHGDSAYIEINITQEDGTPYQALIFSNMQRRITIIK